MAPPDRSPLPTELFDHAWRRGETQLRPPTPHIDYRKRNRFVRPGVIELRRERAIARDHWWAAREKLGIRRLREAQVFLGFFVLNMSGQQQVL